MDRAQESAFAWALLDQAAAFLDEPVRTQLCIQIGAGELREAINELLHRFTVSDTAIPPVLAGSLWAWMNGFVGSDSETSLRDLASRIRLSTASCPPGLAFGVDLVRRQAAATLLQRTVDAWATRELDAN